jgi:hypothetical protein
LEFLVTPDEAVSRLAQIVASRTDFTEDDIYTAMADAGIPPELADRAYKFTLFAWGRIVLDGIGARFSPDYFCFDAAGEIVESGRLADEPCFAAASRLAQQYVHSKGFSQLALMSSETLTVNDALNAGSRPEHLVLAPATRFLEQPTPVGMENVRRFLAGRIQCAVEDEAAKKNDTTTAATPNGKNEIEASQEKRERRIKLTKTAKPWWRFW